MKFLDLKEESLIGGEVRRHWYYRAKLAAVSAALGDMEPRAALDVGSGSGFFPRELLRAGLLRAATCVDPGYPSDRDERAGGKPLLFRRQVASSDAGLVMMMDVIEHVADDVGLVAEYAGKVAGGTRFLVTVPAFQWLWSGHDEFLQHHRRYTLRQLEATLRRGGLRVLGGSYFFGALFPLAAAARIAARLGRRGGEPQGQMKTFGPVSNAVLLGICQAEMPFFRRNRIGGLTAMAWALKP